MLHVFMVFISTSWLKPMCFGKKNTLFGVFQRVNFHFLKTMFHVFKLLHCSALHGPSNCGNVCDGFGLQMKHGKLCDGLWF